MLLLIFLSPDNLRCIQLVGASKSIMPQMWQNQRIYLLGWQAYEMDMWVRKCPAGVQSCFKATGGATSTSSSSSNFNIQYISTVYTRNKLAAVSKADVFPRGINFPLPQVGGEELSSIYFPMEKKLPPSVGRSGNFFSEKNKLPALGTECYLLGIKP